MRAALRDFLRRKLAPYMPHMDTDKAQKYTAILRTIYFFSATTLFLLVYSKADELSKIEQEKSGAPVIKDISPAHARMRKRGVETGIIQEYVPGEGWKMHEYNRNEYLLEMEKQALRRAKEAQMKILQEGGELPAGVVKLVDGIKQAS